MSEDERVSISAPQGKADNENVKDQKRHKNSYYNILSKNVSIRCAIFNYSLQLNTNKIYKYTTTNVFLSSLYR